MLVGSRRSNAPSHGVTPPPGAPGRSASDYDAYGQLFRAKDGNTSATYYELDAADALGRELDTSLGSGLNEYRDYDRANGAASRCSSS
jgi:hypothetical protein